MKKGLFNRFVAILYFVAILVCLNAFDSAAQAVSTGTAWDVLLKVENLSEALNTIDGFFETADGQPGQSPTVMLRGILQGGEWIDPDRMIVVGAIMEEPQPTIAAIVPFRKPNETFQGMMNASSGPDYYLLPLPPGQPASFSAEQESYLAAASKTKAGRTVSLEFFVNRLLKKSERQISEMMLSLQAKQPGSEQGAPDFTPEEARAILTDMLNAASQLESLIVGFDLRPETVSASMEALAMEGTELAELFSPNTTTTLLNNYAVSHQVNFRTARFDSTGMVKFFDKIFGKAYQKMGIDFGQVASVAGYFTGESAGGMTYGIAGAHFESIMVMKEPQKSPEFFDSVYIPWLKNYCDNMQEVLEANTGIKPEPIFRRTKDTEVSGYKSVGVDLRIPSAMIRPDASKDAKNEAGHFVYQLRMTIMDNLFLTAPHDEYLAELIEKAKKLRQGPRKGPLGEVEMDMAAYFNALTESLPGLRSSKPMPDMGKIGYTFDLAQRKLSADTSMKIKDVKNIAEYFKTLSAAEGAVPSSEQRIEPASPDRPESDNKPETTRSRQEPRKPAISRKPVEQPVKKDFDYWMDQGGLVSAYGNYTAAIKYYQKAIELDPKRDEAYYGLGVALGQVERFGESLDALNRAILMNPGKAGYYYARGRVYLLAGQAEESAIDMEKAAEMGNQDARDYLAKNFGR